MGDDVLLIGSTYITPLIFPTGKNLKEGLVSLEEDLVQLTDQLRQEAQCLPNITHPDVPIGGEESSIIRKMVGLALDSLFTLLAFF